MNLCNSHMVMVTLYSRSGCKLCQEVEEDLKQLDMIFPHKLKVIDIDKDFSCRDLYALEIPVVEVGSHTLKAPITRQMLMNTLDEAMNQSSGME